MFDWFNDIPAKYCCLFLPRVVWPMIFADTLIALSYFTLGIFLVWTFIRSVRQGTAGVMHSGWMLFGLFIFFCGLGHAVDVVKIFYPVCDTMTIVRLITAAVSVLTCIWLIAHRKTITALYFAGEVSR